MGKQIIKITEGDLHRMIRESVEQILRENEELEILKDRLRKAKESKNKKAILAAAQAYQKAKERAGVANIVRDPSAYWSDKENIKRGIEPRDGTDRWRVKGNMTMKKELDKDDFSKLKVNPDLGIV